MNTWNIVTGIFGIIGVVAAIATTIIIPLCRKSKCKVNSKNVLVVYEATPPAPPPFGSPISQPIVTAKISIENKMLTDALITKIVLVDKDRNKRISINDNEKGVFEWIIKAKTKRTQAFLFCVPPPKYLLPAQCLLEITVNEKVLSLPVETNSKELPY